MRITDEFLEKLSLQRNLQSCVTNSFILGEAIRDLQEAVAQIQKHLGIEAKSDENFHR